MFQFDSLGNNVKRVFVDDFGYNFDNVSVDYYFSNEV